ncbi:hypothetical protein O7626_26760 [Micromonospora sp. WMMD1102]|uniref:hypothetical protein n=1 Tax=Micromonospora sp. WMMD1102 TaxID=3016105 RepID=UPI00241505F0|nr:hypothetical protein [Micromonospora sp. WMMD1102]MDG4789482.1 hypothetical protein [Micromonospora sp. WMMD1102]
MVSASAERGFSAPPEVVFSTATDPDRVSAWLPEPLRAEGRPGPELVADDLRANWGDTGSSDWSAQLEVSPVDAGGAVVRLDLAADPAQRRLDEIADESLASLAREVDDNLTPG